jgi:branched-subunit amino acid transport protein AzlD
MVKISSNDEFKAWLNGQQQHVHIAIAVRIALRVFPFALLSILEKTPDFVLKSLALATGRVILTSAVQGNKPDADVNQAVKSIYSSRAVHHASSIIYSAINSVTPNAYSAYSVGQYALNTAHSTTQSAHSALTTLSLTPSVFSLKPIEITTRGAEVSAAVSSATSSAYLDANTINHNTTADLLQSPLWNNEKFSGLYKSTWAQFSTHILPDAPEFTFWRDWYQGFLDGKPLDWNLQREVALIPDADWEKGPVHIAELIELIRAKYDLKARVAEAKEVLTEYKTLQTPSIGHNQPPESIDDIPFGPIEFKSVRRELNIISGELEKPSPDKSLFQVASKTLGQIIWKIGTYFAAKMDKSVDEFFKTIGKVTAVGISGALSIYALKLLKVMQPVIDALSTYLPFLS